MLFHELTLFQSAAYCVVLPAWIDYIFSYLAGGETFSKIDLSQANLQMDVEESSRKFLTIKTHKGLYQYDRLGFASAPAIRLKARD